LAADYRIKLTRSQPFEAQEKRLVDLFIEEVENIGSLASAENHYVPELMSALPRRVLTHLLVKPNAQKTAEGVLRQLESLASQTYEGKQVVAAIGMTGSVGHGAISVDALWVEDFARVLSNGFDTMYVVGADGRAFGIESLPLDDIEPFAPNRLGSVARWTKANSNRAAFAL
jgi:hypothetical protein